MAVEQSKRRNNPPGRSAAVGMVSCPVMNGVRRVIMTMIQVMLAVMRKMNQFRLGNGLSLRGGRTDSAFVREADDISMFMVEME